MKLSQSTNAVLLLLLTPVSQAYAPSTLPTVEKYVYKTNPFKTQGLDVDLPDFHHLFKDIQKVSPLARAVITGEASSNGLKGLAAIDEENGPQWKRVENNPKGVVHQIDRLDNFNRKGAPMLRFRSSLKGPLVGECFGRLIIDLEERKKWDTQIENVREIHPIEDLDSANIAMGFGRYGDCSRIGIGYALTKATMGMTPREQLFLYGMQEFADGSSLIWGTEMNEKYNHMFPEGKRHTRATSHLFAATLSPTGEDTFDVEYVLQLDIGGSIPSWLTTPVMIDTVKSLFKVAEKQFALGEEGPAGEFLKEKLELDHLLDRESLLMTF